MVELKKRGRKPAGANKVTPPSVDPTDLSPIQELIVHVNTDTDTETETDLSKKRGRKPKQKTYSVQDTIINKASGDSVHNNKEHVILHFPFSVKDVYNSDPFNNQNLLEYKPDISEPQPFEPDCQANFSALSVSDNLSQAYFIKTITSPEPVKTIKPTGSIMNYIQPEDMELDTKEVEELEEELEELTHKYENEIYVQNSSPFTNEKITMKKNLNKVMYEFLDANKKGEWPMSTNIYCMWCCHPFEGPPCGLPIKCVDEVFYVWGCFCSFNCAAAYNFKEYKVSEVWERYSLLNLLYKKIFDKPFTKIKPAPPREVLTIFGGYLNIDDYRKNMIINDREYKIIRPPIVSIVPKVEESIIEFNNTEKPIPVDKDKIDKAVEKLKLKRSKPLAKNTQTLENFMEMKYY